MMKEVFKNKGYIILMLAQVISSLGDWLSIVAIITMVGLKWNASPMEISLIMLCLAVPMILLGPLAGTVADRFNRKVLMIVSDLIRAGLILILTMATTIEMVYLCLVLVGVLSTVFVPAKNGKLKELVDQEHMKSAMSITSMIDSSTKILGPLLSGILVSALGTNPVFFIDSFTFLLSAGLLFFLPKGIQMALDTEHNQEKEKNSLKRDFQEGMQFIKSNQLLLIGLLFLGISLLILQLADSQVIVLIRELTNVSSKLFGYIVTASGLGMFLSGFILAKNTNYHVPLYMFSGVMGIGLSFGMMGILTHFDVGNALIWGPLLGMLGGFSATFVFVPFQASVQTETPVHMTGRVFGMINSVTTTATIIGPLLGGALSTILGIVPTFMISASLLVVASLVGFLINGKREWGKKDVTESQQRTHGTTAS